MNYAEFGIGPIEIAVLLRGAKNGIYAKRDNAVAHYTEGDNMITYFPKKGYGFWTYEDRFYPLSEYGKTWALTKEELK